jgi:large subunit ribosomal protein L20
MARVKSGVIAHKRKKNVLKHTKGFKWGRKSKFRQAHEAVLHASVHSYRGRKEKKRDFRKLWTVQIGAAAKEYSISYNQLIKLLKEHHIELDRKVLSELAQNYNDIFKEIVTKIK